MLFAQAAPPPVPAGGPPPALFWGIVAGVCGCYLLVPVLYFLLKFFFSRTVARVLERCHPDTRLIEPGLAYLNMIPAVGEVWFLVGAVLVGRSLRAEFEDRDLDDRPGGYGQILGLSAGGCFLAGAILYAASFAYMLANQRAGPNPAVQVVGGCGGPILGLVSLLLFVVYWVRLAGLGRRLADDDEMRAGQESDRRDRDEEPDDPPR